MAPASSIFSCWSAASSKEHPLEIDCATDPLTPAPSSSVSDARKIACGVRNRSSSLAQVRAPRPGTSFSATQCSSSSRLTSVDCIAVKTIAITQKGRKVVRIHTCGINWWQPMKQEPSYFEGKDPVLIYIAKKLREALRLETVFTD